MKLPRDLSGESLVAVLRRLGYVQTRQTGSHVRMTISGPTEGHVTVPLKRFLPTGTLAAIIKDVSVQLDASADEILGKIRRG